MTLTKTRALNRRTSPEELMSKKDKEGLGGLSESALREMYAAHVERIEELRAKPDRTVADAREMRTLTEEANEIVTLVGESQTAEGATLNALPTPPAPRATTEAPAVVDDETDVAESIAAAAEMGALATDPMPSFADRQEMRMRNAPSVVAGAGAAIGGVAELSLSSIGELVEKLAGGGQGRQGRKEEIVTFRQDGIAPVVLAGVGPAATTAAINEYLRGDGDDAITAAPFTVCGPPDILRDVPECDNTDRYVPDWFRTIPSQHGQVQFYRGFSLADALPATTVWDQADQTAVIDTDPDTWKPCIEIGCLTTQTIAVEAVTQCITMRLIDTMTSPEAVGSMLNAARAALARTADAHLLSLYDALASRYTHDAASLPLGATIQVYDVLGRLLGIAAATNRQLDLSGYTLAVESGFMAHLMLDNTMACNARLAAEAAEDLFGGLGIDDIAVTPDWSSAAVGGPWAGALPLNPVASAAIAVPDRPTTWRVRLFKSGDFAMLTPGGEAFGVVPDLANKRKNKVTWFGETFQGLGKLGCSPAFMVEFSSLCATGTRSACETVTCTAAS